MSQLILLFSFAEVLISATSSALGCCKFIDDHVGLISCVNDSNSLSLRKHVERTTVLFGPTMHFAILTRATDQIFQYASYSVLVQSLYAERNGYLFLPLFKDSDDPDYERYRKLAPLLQAIRTYAFDVDYLVWVDAGAVSFIRCFDRDYIGSFLQT